MALSPAVLTTGLMDPGVLSVSVAISPRAGAMLMVFIGGNQSSGSAPTLTYTGLSGVVAHLASSGSAAGYRISAVHGMVPASPSGNLGIALDSNDNGVGYLIADVTGAGVTWVQTAITFGTAASLSCALDNPTPQAATSRCFGLFLANGTDIAPGTNFTEIGQCNNIWNSEVMQLEWRSDAFTATATATRVGGSASFAASAFELSEGAATKRLAALGVG